MTFEIAETTPTGRRNVATFESFDAAKAHAEGPMKALFFEEDKDFPGCADFITKEGSVYLVQPVGFQIS